MRIVSASRRTDIPAFYAPWFMNRVREGFVRVPNPFNTHQIATVDLRPEQVACLVFWTKNPRPMFAHLAELERRGLRFYFQVTATGLPPTFEPGAPSPEASMTAIEELAKLIGRDRIVWRFDPILVSRLTPCQAMIDTFLRMADRLSDSVRSVTISFARDYRRVTSRIRRTLPHADARFFGPDSLREKGDIASAIAAVAKDYGLTVQSCAEPHDLSPWGVTPGSCIDPRLINDMFGLRIPEAKDSGQRSACRCAPSVDIGIYGTCPHNCVYCYASCSDSLARGKVHDPHAPSLLT